MNKLNLTVLLLLSFLFFSSIIAAQDLQLTSDKKIRTIKAGTFIELSLASSGQEPCLKCPIYGVRGRLISSSDGKISLAVYQSREQLIEDKANVGYLTKSYRKKAIPTVSFPATDILSITKKGKKRINKYSTLQSVGMVLTLVGFGHLVSAPYVSQTDTKTANTLIGAGLVGMVSGIIINRTFRQKTFYTSESCPQKKPGKKVWVIN